VDLQEIAAPLRLQNQLLEKMTMLLLPLLLLQELVVVVVVILEGHLLKRAPRVDSNFLLSK
jgi:hypothetical protein